MAKEYYFLKDIVKDNLMRSSFSNFCRTIFNYKFTRFKQARNLVVAKDDLEMLLEKLNNYIQNCYFAESRLHTIRDSIKEFLDNPTAKTISSNIEI